MTDTQTIEVIDSWDITSFGIIAELKHQLNGLQSGLVLKSQSTGNEWIIKNRILFSHTYGKQKIFTNETATHSYLSFESIEKQFTSAKNILDKEEHSIFQYQLQPIEHISIPLKGDSLIKIEFQRFACPCCGYKTFGHQPDGPFDICNVCSWEDDPLQLADPDYKGGANKVSLRQAQKNFQKFGACEEDMIKSVKQSSIQEARDEKWNWLE